jgi:FtsP/CotA-like multicopper oxidase with cupredoxin domain
MTGTNRKATAAACAFLALAAVLLAGRAGAARAGGRSGKPQAAAASVLRLSARQLAATDQGTAPTTDWSEPPILEGEGNTNTVNVELDVRYAWNSIWINGQEQRLWLRSYNGGLVGPTIRVKAGDTLNVLLRNNLPKETDALGMGEMKMDGTCAAPTHGFNVTNLHTHGLHISPSGTSDNVYIEVPPGGGRQPYTFKILPNGNPEGAKPARQYAGTFWYHAHQHGATAMQLASGMAGALLVLGDVDEVPEIKAARQRLFLFQQIAYDKEGKVESFDDLGDNWAANGKRTLINGQLKPLLRMRQGEVERWRFIDSGLFTDLPVVIASTGPGAFSMYRIALDGITRPRPEPVSEIDLAPGYRADVLVQAPRVKGRFLLYKKKSLLFSPKGTSSGPAADDPQVLAEIEVGDDACTEACRLPERLPAPVDMLPDIKKEELTRKDPIRVAFRLKDGFFTINDSCFDADKVKPEFAKKLGDVEEWEISNFTRSPHPFHIHVNAFQMLDARGQPAEWRDTILVPPAVNPTTPGVVRFRTRYERFDGKFVLHCHILPHEDEGMMMAVTISK